jgi:hypothetical protein
MAYEANIPLPRDRYRVSQGDILQNFQAIYDVTNVNHVVFNDADQGKHKFVQFPQQTTSPTTGGTQVAVYSAAGFTNSQQPNSVTGLVFKRSSGTVINFTDTFVDTINLGLLPNQLFHYWNRLPSGLLIKINTFFLDVNPSNVSSPPPVISQSIGVGPAFQNIYWTNITPQRNPFIDPNAPDADPNVVIYNLPPVLPNPVIRFIAWTRNLSGTARRNPKTAVIVRTIIIGD